MPVHIKPEQLSARTLLLYHILLLVLFTCFMSGVVGVFILQDIEQSYTISRTRWAEYYQQLIAWNPMISAILVNGPLLGIVFLSLKLHGHTVKKREAEGSAGHGQRIKQAKQL